MAMVYEPLHHKYRPQSFAQLVGQHAIATTLCSALQQQRIPPAYLFCGPRGTGKTSSARILAKSLNCVQTDNPTPTPCGQCETCRSITKGSALDVIEIDAASNTGVDNIRELIERSQFAPVQCRYKVYVIDECLTGDTLVQTREGLVRIDNPQIEGQHVLSYNEQTGDWEYKKALRWLDQGTRDILEIQTTHRRIRCTGNHLIRTNVGWVAARDVKEGMTILSPVTAVAAPSSTNTVLMGEFAALSEAINSKAIHTGERTIAPTTSLLKQSRFAPCANADVARSSRSPNIFSKKVTASAAFSPTGNDTLSQKGTVAGNLEPRTIWQRQASYLTGYLASFMGRFWEMGQSPIPTSTAAFPDWLGLTVPSKQPGWSTKQVGSKFSVLSCNSLRTKATVNSPFVAEQPVTLTSKLSLLPSDLTTVQKTLLSDGSPKSLKKDGPGGTWMTAPSVSVPKEAHKFNFTPKVTLVQRTNSSLDGSLTWATHQQSDPLFAEHPVSVTTTSLWALTQQGNGSQICSSMPSPRWHTSLETVVSVRPAGREPVYDIEVEDNHNFVANGLLVHNCHMLSTAAFNALLKTLEEPPERVVFVLATTDPQRVLPTIISRCQRFDFRRIPLEEMVAHLQTIANQEGIKIAPDALRLVAQVSQGGLRDAQSLLDQLSLLTEGVTVEQVWDLVGAVPERNLLALVQAIAADDGVQVLEQARHLMDRGREPLVVLQNLASFYRDLLVAKTACDRNDLVAITPSTWAELVNFAQSLELGLILAGQQRLREAEVQVKNTTQPRLWLEVTLLGLLPSTLAAQTVAVRPDTRSALPSRRESQLATPPAASTPVPPAQSTSPQATVSASSTPASSPAQTRPASSQPTAAAAAGTAHASDRSASPTVKEKEATAQPVQSVPDELAIAAPAQSAKPASTPTPTPAPATPPAPQVNIRDIWQQVIGRLHPLSKALLKEHGELLEYTGNQATVAISSRNLLKIAQSKVPDIEKAFAQVVNQPIRISLTVAADSSGSSSSSSSSSTGAPADSNANQQSGVASTAQPLDGAPAANPQNSNLVTHSTHGPSHEANGTQPENGALDSTAQSEPRAVSDVDAPQSNGTPSVVGAAFEPVGPMPSVYTEDAVARASRSFAQFFNGHVVELNEADAIFWSATADLAQSTSATSQSTSSGRATAADDQNGHAGQTVQSEATPNESMHAEQMHDALPDGSAERTSTSTITSIPPASNSFSSTYDESDDDDDDDDDLPF